MGYWVQKFYQFLESLRSKSSVGFIQYSVYDMSTVVNSSEHNEPLTKSIILHFISHLDIDWSDCLGVHVISVPASPEYAKKHGIIETDDEVLRTKG